MEKEKTLEEFLDEVRDEYRSLRNTTGRKNNGKEWGLACGKVLKDNDLQHRFSPEGFMKAMNDLKKKHKNLLASAAEEIKKNSRTPKRLPKQQKQDKGAQLFLSF